MITFLFPLLEDVLRLRVLVDDGLSQPVAVVGCCLVDGAVLQGLTDGGQRLNHQPGGIVGIFDGQLLLRRTGGQQFREVDGLHPRPMLGEGHRARHVFAVGQDGQVVLFAVREAVARGDDLTDEELSVEC